MKTNLMHSLLQEVSKASNNNSVKKTTKHENNYISSEEIFKNKSLKSVLKSLLLDLVNKNETSKNVLNILKNETIFKEFKSFSGELKLFLKMLSKNNIDEKELNSIKKIIIDVKLVDNKILKTNIAKSGIFLESYLKNLSLDFKTIGKNNMNFDVLDDIKTILLKISDDKSNNKELLKQANKLLTQIDYYQLLSSSGYSNHTYLPFDWEQLEDGNINFTQNDDENFTCHILLQLKYYGDVKINMLFIKPNQLSLTFFVEQELLKEKLKNNLQKIRQYIKNVDIELNLLNVLDLVEYENASNEIKAYTKYENSFKTEITV